MVPACGCLRNAIWVHLFGSTFVAPVLDTPKKVGAFKQDYISDRIGQAGLD